MTEPNKQSEPQKRLLPRSDLDFNLMMTDTLWSSLSPELKTELTEKYQGQDDAGQQITWEEHYTTVLGIFTRDLRLANLSTWDGELVVVRYHLDLATDLIQTKMRPAAAAAIARVAGILETSQSKGGFLRRRQNTFTQEHFQSELEPKKKSLFGKQQKGRD